MHSRRTVRNGPSPSSQHCTALALLAAPHLQLRLQHKGRVRDEPHTPKYTRPKRVVLSLVCAATGQGTGEAKVGGWGGWRTATEMGTQWTPLKAHPTPRHSSAQLHHTQWIMVRQWKAARAVDRLTPRRMWCHSGALADGETEQALTQLLPRYGGHSRRAKRDGRIICRRRLQQQRQTTHHRQQCDGHEDNRRQAGQRAHHMDA
jgi:hypothetical protein